MATKKITDLITRSGVTDDLYFPSDDGIESYKVSGAQIKNYINAAGYSTYTANATMAATDSLIFLDSSSAAFALTLLAASTLPGRRLTFIKTNSSTANQVTLTGTISGIANIKMTAQYERMTIVSNGTAWFLEAWSGFCDEVYLTDDGATKYGTTDIRTRRYGTIITNIGSAIGYSVSAANGSKFTIAYPGSYAAWIYDRKSVSGNYGSFTVNSSDPTTTPLAAADSEILSTDYTMPGASAQYWTGLLKAGDVVRFMDNDDTNGSATPKFKMQRIG